MGDSPENDGSATSKPILLGGEDAMEEDENIPTLPPSEAPGSDELIARIITPSPYAHHMTGATASRFRNAMSRIATDPTSDVEAWQAIITEANACYRNIIPSLHAVDAETHAKLDWIESCFGALLKYFPYAHAYYVSVVEILLAQSARVGEEEGPLLDYGRDPSQRAIRCEAKIEVIFRKILGVEMDGTATDDKLGGMCTSSVELWLLYVRKRVRDANRYAASLQTPEEKADLVRQWSTDAYEVAIKHCSFASNNHLIWKQYLAFVKSWITVPGVDHALAQKQMIQLRSVYQRLATHPMTGLDQLWQEYEAFERGQNEALAAALIAEFAPKYQHARSVYLERNRVYNVADLQMGRLATPPANVADEDYAGKMQEENQLLTFWKKRCSFERTNPERLVASDLVQRVRQAYKEMACAMTRHPEAWHMWAMWELLRSAAKEDEKAECAIAVLQLGQACVPDCTLLSYAEGQVVELHTDRPSNCVDVMERFLDRSPNTLGFVLYQQMVRRYKGVQPAREVFARARRVLLDHTGKHHGATKEKSSTARDAATETAEEEKVDAVGEERKDQNGSHRMVTNRLDSDIGTATPDHSNSAPEELGQDVAGDVTSTQGGGKAMPGVVTWQLYASHAMMEHRLNHAPAIAARVYELGLRKHASFLTKPSYILRYAQLLLELEDTENLRALLSRAVTACEAEAGKSAVVTALWDMTLRFEAITSGQDASNVSNFDSVERRRRVALYGEEVEDVSTGGLLSTADASAGVGAHKSTISEQLVRSEGYDVSSSIVNGLSRTVDVLEIMGIWGGGGSSPYSKRASEAALVDSDDVMVGGVSDASYQHRLQFQALVEAGVSAEVAGAVDASSKSLTARERLQQAAGPASQTSANALAIQQSPEWLRSLLMLLPASRFRTAAMNKPPPHMIEMALSSLRNSALPTERPVDDGTSGDPRKRKRGSGGDSSDEENGNIGGGGGYGSQFRSRQRARQMGLTGESSGLDNPASNQ